VIKKRSKESEKIYQLKECFLETNIENCYKKKKQIKKRLAITCFSISFLSFLLMIFWDKIRILEWIDSMSDLSLLTDVIFIVAVPVVLGIITWQSRILNCIKLNLDKGEEK